MVPCLGAAVVLAAGTGRVGDAVANGETRTLEVYHTHTKESASITYKKGGSFDKAALEKLNWLLRDWRRDEPTSMDPRLFDIVWEVRRAVGSQEPLHIVSAYRAPETNAMLRRRSRAVAKHSQHMEGKAMDFYLPDVSMGQVREIALRMQRGGVGYYPTSYNPFVHLDAGSVRHWPRMSRDQLARLFPDGKTVHIPSDGKPMPRYEEAAAEIEAGGGSVSAYADAGDEGGLFSTRRGKSFFAALFGGADEEEDVAQAQATRAPQRQAARRDTGQQQLAAYTMSGTGDDYGRPVFFANTSVRPTESVPVAVPRRVTAPPPEPVTTAAAPAAAPVPAPAAESAPRQVWQTGPSGAPLVEAPVASVPLPLARPTDIAGLTAFANVPMPPARPVEIAALGAGAAAAVAAMPPLQQAQPAAPVTLTYANVPLPPMRPAGVGTAAIVQAARTSPAAPAPTAPPVTPPPAPVTTAAREPAPGLTAGTLDRSGLKALFATASISGPAEPGGRQMVATAKTRPADRDLSGLTNRPSAAVANGFNPPAAGDLATDRFTGPAVKPLPVHRFTPAQ
ncbi:DUF882 domain-containing protein [Alsobacter sp. R-9]